MFVNLQSSKNLTAPVCDKRTPEDDDTFPTAPVGRTWQIFTTSLFLHGIREVETFVTPVWLILAFRAPVLDGDNSCANRRCLLLVSIQAEKMGLEVELVTHDETGGKFSSLWAPTSVPNKPSGLHLGNCACKAWREAEAKQPETGAGLPTQDSTKKQKKWLLSKSLDKTETWRYTITKQTMCA